MCKSLHIGVQLLLGPVAYAPHHAYLYSLSHHGVSSMRRWTCPLCGNLDHRNTPKFRVQWQWIWWQVLKKNISILVFAGIWTQNLKLKYHINGKTTRSGDIPNSNIWNPAKYTLYIMWNLPHKIHILKNQYKKYNETYCCCEVVQVSRDDRKYTVEYIFFEELTV